MCLFSDTCSVLKSTACTPCNCHVNGSSSTSCDDNGVCSCKGTFWGAKCSNRDCRVTSWSAWAGCGRCGYSDPKTRTRRVSAPPIGMGKQCPSLQETGRCTMIPCDCKEKNPGYYGPRCDNRDCELGSWGRWSTCESCNRRCGGRYHCWSFHPYKSRSRKVRITKVGNGRECSDKTTDSESCGYECKKVCNQGMGMNPGLVCKLEKV